MNINNTEIFFNFIVDYDYVNSCQDIKKLRAVLKVLESGKEGHYPHVIIIHLKKNYLCYFYF